MSPHDVMYKLVDRELMRTLMQRTGTGGGVSVRELAADVRLPHGTIGNLLSGYQTTQPYDKALAIAQRIGVDLLILWTPIERSLTAIAPIEEAVPA